MQAPSAKPAEASATTAAATVTAPLGGFSSGMSSGDTRSAPSFGAGVSSFGAASSSSSGLAGGVGGVESLVVTLAEGFRLQGMHATAGQLATCLKPVQVAMDHGNATDNDHFNQAVRLACVQ